jgi:hypothetical protein
MQDVKIIIHNILKYVKIKLPGYYISEMDWYIANHDDSEEGLMTLRVMKQ